MVKGQAGGQAQDIQKNKGVRQAGRQKQARVENRTYKQINETNRKAKTTNRQDSKQGNKTGG